jgi:hypothetical protein
MESPDGGKRILLKSITDNIAEEFSSSADLKVFIQKHESLPFFFDKTEEKIFYKEELNRLLPYCQKRKSRLSYF